MQNTARWIDGVILPLECKTIPALKQRRVCGLDAPQDTHPIVSVGNHKARGTGVDHLPPAPEPVQNKDKFASRVQRRSRLPSRVVGLAAGRAIEVPDAVRASP